MILTIKLTNFCKTLILISLSLLCLGTTAIADDELVKRPEVKQFINKMVKKHNFNREELREAFQKAKIEQKIIDSMNKQYEALPWYKYKKLFLDESRIEKGVQFWQNNKKALDKAEEKFGVPPEIIVAIIGVETRYGAYTGNIPVLNSLATLAFAYPRRAEFFTKELEQYLLLAKEQGFDLNKTTGSFAGAMGKPQFIPSSYRNYAIDFDGDGVADLFNSNTDVIGSVANYFYKHRWQKNAPIALQATISGDSFKEKLANSRKPIVKYNIAELTQLGIRVNPEIDPNTKLSIIGFDVDNKEKAEYWVGFQNFYVITRYNLSNNYAMAVNLLAEQIRRRYLQEYRKEKNTCH